MQTEAKMKYDEGKEEEKKKRERMQTVFKCIEGHSTITLANSFQSVDT